MVPFIESEFREYAFVVKQVTTADYLICRRTKAGEAGEGAKAGEAGEGAKAGEAGEAGEGTKAGEAGEGAKAGEAGDGTKAGEREEQEEGTKAGEEQEEAKAKGGGAVVLAAIERKSHQDFAASFKDGRHENVKKMIALRAATGCALFYFVEGPAFPDASQRYSGIPFANILAAMTRLMVSDGIFVVQTESAAHSAKRLLDFVRVFDTAPVFGARPVPSQGADLADRADLADLAVPEILTRRAEESDREAAVCMWTRLSGISVTIGALLTETFSVAELASRAVSPESIRALRTEAGRPINKDAVASLLGVRDGSVELGTLIVSGLRGITPAVARILLDATGGLAGLAGAAGLAGLAGLAAVQIAQKTRSVQFGKARAERVQRLLNYKAR